MMMNKKAFEIFKYILLVAVALFSIYKIVDLSIDLSKDFKANLLVGIIIFSIVVILCIGTFIQMIRIAIYKSKFKK